MNEIINKVKDFWGANSSRGFKIGSWVTAIGVFSLWQYYSSADNHKKITFSNEDATKWNNKVKTKQNTN